MKESVDEIKAVLVSHLSNHIPPLRTKSNHSLGQVFEGTKPGMQGKQKVDGYYFASIVPKPKDCRFYFFPLYTHVNHFQLSSDLKKCLKGKTCFHIKKIDEGLEKELKQMIDKGVDFYLSDGLI